jgi:hypothetical protein
MSDSTHVLADTQTLAKTSFTPASITKAMTTDDVDLVGEATAVFVAISEARRALELIIANLDAADPQLVLANDILGTLT